MKVAGGKFRVETITGGCSNLHGGIRSRDLEADTMVLYENGGVSFYRDGTAFVYYAPHCLVKVERIDDDS